MSAGPRIVSLLPSATEIVYALGLGDRLVGRSHECDFPPEAQELPICSRPRLDARADSAAIDSSVKALLSQGLSIYEVDAERLAELAPDVILTQTQCEVCAVSPADIELALTDWTGARPRVVSLAPERLRDVWQDVVTAGEALGVPERARHLVRALGSAVDALADAARAAGGGRPRPRVACIEWIDPLMAAGNWIPELVDLAGGETLFGEAGAHSPWLEWSALRAADPQAVVLMPCGFDLERTLSEAARLESHPGWEELSAVREGRVTAVDGHQYFNRPGPRLVDSLAILIAVLHGPETVPAYRETLKTSTSSVLPRTATLPMASRR